MSRSQGTLLILGGTSAVAQSYARLQAARGRRIVLAGRRKPALAANADDLVHRGASEAGVVVCDLADTGSLARHWDAVVAEHGPIGEVLIAYGLLGEQADTQGDAAHLEASLRTNFTSAALWAERAFDHMNRVGQGQITVIGSVAGDRGRQSNYHYGAAKGALERFMQGMAHRAAKTPEAKIGVLLVKPGFIDTPMTDHLDKGGPLWATPEQVAGAIDRAVARGRNSVYAPWFWRYILLIIRSVPRFVFHRTGL